MPTGRASRPSTSSRDLAGPLGAADAAIEARLERLTWRGVHLLDVAFAGRSVNQHLTINDLTVGDFAEAKARMSGEVDLADGVFDLSAELSGVQPARLLRRLGREPSRLFLRVKPLKVEGQVRGSLEAAQVELEIGDGSARVELAGEVGWADRQARYSLDLQAEHPDYRGCCGISGPVRTGRAGLRRRWCWPAKWRAGRAEHRRSPAPRGLARPVSRARSPGRVRTARRSTRGSASGSRPRRCWAACSMWWGGDRNGRPGTASFGGAGRSSRWRCPCWTGSTARWRCPARAGWPATAPSSMRALRTASSRSSTCPWSCGTDASRASCRSMWVGRCRIWSLPSTSKPLTRAGSPPGSACRRSSPVRPASIWKRRAPATTFTRWWAA